MFSVAETILTAIVLIGSVVAVLHAIAEFATVDALAVPALGLVRRTNCNTEKKNNIEIINYSKEKRE